MKGLQTETIESLGHAPAALVLALPRVTFLSYQQVAILSPMAFGLVIDKDDCLVQGYTCDEVVYPIASSFGGFGFHALIQNFPWQA